jgi:hypothetical protein
MGSNEEGIVIYSKNSGPKVISTNTFTKLSGEICKSTFLIDPKDVPNFSQCLKE